MDTVAPFLIASLSIWLGINVAVRTARGAAARVFGLLTLLLALYGVARLVGRLTASAAVRSGALRLEFGVNSVLPAALLHLALALTTGRAAARGPRILLAAAYAAGIVMGTALAATGTGGLSIRGAAGRTFLGLPEAPLAAVWAAARLLLMAGAALVAIRAWSRAPARSSQRQLWAVVGSIVLGTVGGIVTIMIAQFDGPEWIGLSAVAMSLALAAYAVLGKHIFLTPEVARSALLVSLFGGALVATYVALLIGIEWLARRVLQVESPLLLALPLVLTIAAFDPARDRARALLDRRVAARERQQRRLLRALGDELLTSERPDAAIQPALAQVCITLDMSTATIVAPDGRTLAAFGAAAPAGEDDQERALRVGQHTYGMLRCARRPGARPASEAEAGVLDQSAAFFAAALHLARRQASEAAALEALAGEHAAFQAQEVALVTALDDVEATEGAGKGRLRVFALGPLRVERGGERIERWGGAKAGTRQAQAIFAFLFDRGERGVAKDEVVELLWAETPLEKADLAFHRTLGGLRRMLEPGARRASESSAIIYRNDRYYLDPLLIDWSDVSAFEEQIGASSGLTGEGRVRALEAARSLWRGDYLEDCPFYGDSSFVEERRRMLRGRYLDLLLALGEHWEARDASTAALCFREALRVSGDDCQRADDGLARLGLPLLEP